MTKEAMQSSEILKSKLQVKSPNLAIILGSGLGELANEIKQQQRVSYEELPGFHKPDVAGHAGECVFGQLDDVPVMCLHGRAHLYEGIDSAAIRTMIRTCRLLGCEALITTGATGSLNQNVLPGRLVLIKDHINFQFTNPLCGANDEVFGPRFIGLEDAYHAEYRSILMTLAQTLQIELAEGVYLSTLGPAFETPAEINAFRQWGADVVGMSVVPEVIVARHCGLKVAALALVTNLAAGLHPGVLSHEETLRGATLGSEKMLALVRAFVKKTFCS